MRPRPGDHSARPRRPRGRPSDRRRRRSRARRRRSSACRHGRRSRARGRSISAWRPCPRPRRSVGRFPARAAAHPRERRPRLQRVAPVHGARPSARPGWKG
ncbi:MAG: hypothetical protein E6G76_14005 [Alphaproteobacteria bacterium]|nr:MAG: hypothetical protein E6G76_14005 [Alphaproteobacteria bacterium]